MIEVDLRGFLELRSPVTHYVIFGTMQGENNYIESSIKLVDEERFNNFIRYDQAGRIRADFESNPIRLFVTPLPNDKGNPLNEFASSEFVYVAGLLGFSVEVQTV